MVPESELRRKRGPTKSYYEKQNLRIASYALALPGEDENDNLDRVHARSGLVAGRVSTAFNVVLLVAKLVVAVRAHSVAVVASALDSVLDVANGIALAYAARLRHSAVEFDYPAGAARAEPVMMMVFSTVLVMSNLQVVIEAVQRLMKPAPTSAPAVLLAIMGCVVGIKLFLFILCSCVLSSSSTVRALAIDHRNDIVSNGLSLLCLFLGSRFPSLAWIDPAGGLVFSLVIMWIWSLEGLEHARGLVGVRAEPEFIEKALAVCITHPGVPKIEYINAFRLGSGIVCEVDICVDPTTPTSQSHDIAEALQNKLEQLPSVERAIVHIDYETVHRAYSHRIRKSESGSTELVHSHPVTWRHRM
jgi:cation diffusion facilitator family transporter